MNWTSPGSPSGQGRPTALRGETNARSPIHATLQAIFGAMGRGFGPVPALGGPSPRRVRSQGGLAAAAKAEGERHHAAPRLARGERHPAAQPQTRALAQAGAQTQLRAPLPPPGQQPWPAKAEQPTYPPHQLPVQPHADWHAYTRQRLLAAWLGRAPESGQTAPGRGLADDAPANPVAPLPSFFPL